MVLIIDYILDWAHDTYRPSILRQLKCIGARGAYSDYTVTHDSDVFPVVNLIGEWLGAQSGQAAVPTVVATDPRNTHGYPTKDMSVRHVLESQAEVQEQEKGVQLQELGFDLTYRYGRVKNGTALESRVRGIYITADNLGTILQGLGNLSDQRLYVDKIDKIIEIQRRCFILDDARAIGTMEQIWTGDSATTLSHPTLISVQVRFWVTHDWRLVRELNYLTITEEAYSDLLRKRNKLRIVEAPKWKRISAQRLVSFVKDKDKEFREDFFIRCLERQVLVLHHSPRMDLRHDARISGKRGRSRNLQHTSNWTAQAKRGIYLSRIIKWGVGVCIVCNA